MTGAQGLEGTHVGGKEAAMSQKKDDVLHIPPEAYPTGPDREAGTEEDAPHHRGPPHLRPDGGPGNTPGSGGNPRIIEPAGTPRPYPGVSVT
ncbi:hypothetical protein Q664_17700 [Archangium violaceum Cb vi76]|uniref:Uncharacterized protein n=2 Tax=Archangium violaceum TaxID=83451 RepID=A0A084SUK0_9BACT|nr:hypothetical protein Q664_17700 [Archangium violaceum Cb vi76]